MLAVFKTGGKQYSAKTGQIVKVEKLKGNKGDDISFNNVLAICDDKNNTIGSPLINGAIVKAKIVDQIRDKKVIVFKKRQRQNYRSTQGHRQYLTILKIESISIGNKVSSKKSKDDNVTKESNKTETKITTKKKTTKKKVAVKKTAIKKKKTLTKK